MVRSMGTSITAVVVTAALRRGRRTVRGGVLGTTFCSITERRACWPLTACDSLIGKRCIFGRVVVVPFVGVTLRRRGLIRVGSFRLTTITRLVVSGGFSVLAAM